MKAPSTLQEAIIYFADADNCLAYMVAHRWPDGVVAPLVAADDVDFLKSAQVAVQERPRQAAVLRQSWDHLRGFASRP